MLRFDVQLLSRPAQAPRESRKSHDRESYGAPGLADAVGHDASSWPVDSVVGAQVLVSEDLSL
jgi:hypothetical protein